MIKVPCKLYTVKSSSTLDLTRSITLNLSEIGNCTLASPEIYYRDQVTGTITFIGDGVSAIFFTGNTWVLSGPNIYSGIILGNGDTLSIQPKNIGRKLYVNGKVNVGSTTPPVASSVVIDNLNPKVGDLLTGSYVYEANDGGTEGASTFRWLRDSVAIAGATSITYTPVEADIDAVLQFEVTPVGTLLSGDPVESTGTQTVIPDLLDYFNVHIFDVNEAENSTPTKVAAGDDITTWIDSVGTSNATYIGTTPIGYWGFTGARVVEMPGNDKLGAWFPNFRDVEYKTPGTYTGKYPLHWYIVLYGLVGLNGENTNKGANAPNLRDSGAGNAIRIGLNTTDDIVPLSDAGVTWPRNQYSIIEVQLNGSSSRLFLNGVQVGTDITTNNLLTMVQYFLGSANNVSSHIKLLELVNEGILNSSQRSIVYNHLSNLYPVGSSVDAPYADNIQVDDSGVGVDGIVHFTWDENLFNGNPIATRNIRIIQNGTGGAPDLGNQTVLLTATPGTNQYNFDIIAAFGASPSLTWYRIDVQLIDDQGNKFDDVYMTGTLWRRDNIAR